MKGGMASDIVEADFLVCCNHGRTSKACTHTMRALRDSFLNIREINGVRPFGDTEDMCVTGTALIRRSSRAGFERDLKGTRIPGRNRRITKAVVMLPP